MKYLHMVAYVLLWVGGINWGLIGLFQFNLVATLGLPAGLVSLIYVLVGAAAVYTAATHMTYCKDCAMMMKK